MSFAHSRDAVIEWLVAPAALVDLKGPGADDLGAGGWRARTLPGKPYVAERETIEIIKERGDADRRLFATTFVDLDGNAWSYLVAAERSDVGWSAHDVAGGSDGPSPPRARRPEPEPEQPMVDVFGQWGPNVLYVGARLRGDCEGAVTAIRLTLTDGAEMTEDTIGGLALFVGRHGAQPDTVEVLAADGAVIAAQAAF
jgi:hypothetical protein